ncbi:MAG: acyltransferase, partial [Oscillospiraceae bacterium]|nr:acyltransferase [Oscillospiraceae bacterium]
KRRAVPPHPSAERGEAAPNIRDAITLFELILCVVIIAIHSYANTAPALTPGENIPHDLLYMLRRIIAFSVPGFVFTAGLKYAMSMKKRAYFPYIWGRVLRVYLPYVLWCVVYFLYFVYTPMYSYPLSFSDFFGYLLRGDLVAHLYFVLMIMQFYLLAPLILRAARAIPARAGIPAALALQFLLIALARKFPGILQWNTVFAYYIAYWVIGTYFALNAERTAAFLRDNTLAVSAACAAVIALYAAVWARGYYVRALWAVEYVRALAAIAETILAVTLCLRVKFGRLDGFFRLFHGASFYIYLAHPLSIYIAMQYDKYHALGRFSTRFLWVFAFALVPTAALSMIYTAIKNKYTNKYREMREAKK